MPRFKEHHYDQDKFISIRFSKQILPGTFEYTLSYLVDHVIDVSVFDARYRNDVKKQEFGVRVKTYLSCPYHRHPETAMLTGKNRRQPRLIMSFYSGPELLLKIGFFLRR